MKRLNNLLLIMSSIGPQANRKYMRTHLLLLFRMYLKAITAQSLHTGKQGQVKLIQ